MLFSIGLDPTVIFILRLYALYKKSMAIVMLGCLLLAGELGVKIVSGSNPHVVFITDACLRLWLVGFHLWN